MMIDVKLYLTGTTMTNTLIQKLDFAMQNSFKKKVSQHYSTKAKKKGISKIYNWTVVVKQQTQSLPM